MKRERRLEPSSSPLAVGGEWGGRDPHHRQVAMATESPHPQTRRQYVNRSIHSPAARQMGRETPMLRNIDRNSAHHVYWTGSKIHRSER